MPNRLKNIDSIRHEVIDALVTRFVPEHSIDEQWDLPGLQATLQSEWGLHLPLIEMLKGREEVDAERIAFLVQDAVDKHCAEREASIGAETMRALEKHVMLTVLDQGWKEHLATMDYLRQGIHLRGYAQKQPKQEYKREAFELFSEMLEHVKREVIASLARVRIRSEEEMATLEEQERRQVDTLLRQSQFQHQEAGGYGAGDEAVSLQRQPAGQGAAIAQVIRDTPKVGRNDPCPCGSGKKYKHCHGLVT